MSIREQGMLATLTITQWSARKTDRQVTQRVQEEARAAAGSGQYRKRLVAEEAIRPVEQAARKARTWHTSHSLPWKDGGARIITTAIYWDYLRAMQDFRAEFELAVDAFCDAYPQFREDARRYLGDTFNEDDYPSVAKIRSRFTFTTEVDPIPAAEDFRLDLNDSEVRVLQASLEERMQARIKASMADLWSRVHDVTRHMLERLQAYDQREEGAGQAGAFRDTVVSNVRELVNVLGPLNLTGDVDLDRMRVRLADELGRHEAQTLRDSPTARQETIDAAQDILRQMAGYTGMAHAA